MRIFVFKKWVDLSLKCCREFPGLLERHSMIPSDCNWVPESLWRLEFVLRKQIKTAPANLILKDVVLVWLNIPVIHNRPENEYHLGKSKFLELLNDKICKRNEVIHVPTLTSLKVGLYSWFPIYFNLISPF